MYNKAKQRPIRKTQMRVNDSQEGEHIETKIERILENQEKIIGEAPIIYTPREDGVPAGMNIRTDRFELAIDGKDAIVKSKLAKRDATMTAVKDEQGKDTKGESIQGKDNAK